MLNFKKFIKSTLLSLSVLGTASLFSVHANPPRYMPLTCNSMLKTRFIENDDRTIRFFKPRCAIYNFTNNQKADVIEKLLRKNNKFILEYADNTVPEEKLFDMYISISEIITKIIFNSKPPKLISISPFNGTNILSIMSV